MIWLIILAITIALFRQDLWAVINGALHERC